VRNPRICDVGFDEIDKLSREAEGSENLEEEGVIDPIEGIGHV